MSSRLFALCGAILLSWSTSALASTFHVNPVSITLTPKAASALITISNTGTEPLRLQLSMHEWDQDRDGIPQLTATEAVVAFPSIITIPGNSERKIRVGALNPAPLEAEQTYRLFLEEMPNEVAPSGNAIRVLTQISIPVFIPALQPQEHHHISLISIKDGAVTFDITNEGNTHSLAQKVTAKGWNAVEEVVFDKNTSGTYLLPQRPRRYTLPIERCATVKAITIEADVPGTPISQRFDLPAGACSK